MGLRNPDDATLAWEDEGLRVVNLVLKLVVAVKGWALTFCRLVEMPRLTTCQQQR